MRLYTTTILLVALAICEGCAPGLTDPSGNGLISAVAGITESGTHTPVLLPAEQGADGSTIVSGSVAERGDYKLIELGAGATGEEWTVADASTQFAGGPFLVVLFDSEYELLQRQVVSTASPLEHIVRTDSSTLYLGVTPSYTGRGGDFCFEVTQQTGLPVPAPQRQVVWLNFDDGSDIKVHTRSGVSFPAFDAAILGSAYDGGTEVVKAAIVEAMREDYAPYNVVIRISDDGPPPDGPYATLHFGGGDDRLLGLADNVDQYNADRWQHAIVYVEGFSDFAIMALTDEEMGQMIGNVASHELGHLLGLFHTQVPEDLMDTTGTAWDLAADQSFLRAELEPTVFPYGFENSPMRLVETVGTKPVAKEIDLAKPAWTQEMLRKAALRAMMRAELRCRCGNCLNPDE